MVLWFLSSYVLFFVLLFFLLFALLFQHPAIFCLRSQLPNTTLLVVQTQSKPLEDCLYVGEQLGERDLLVDGVKAVQGCYTILGSFALARHLKVMKRECVDESVSQR
jgi:hypothetical protein